MSPEIKMLLVYFVASLILVIAVMCLIKIDPRHEEIAREEYIKRLKEELKRVGGL